jgi:hypothetical protein
MGIFDQNEDNDNLVAKMIAHQQGREPTQEEIDAHNQIAQQGIDMGAGVLGTVGGGNFKGLNNVIAPAAKAVAPEAVNVAEQTLPSMADRIRAAAANSKVKNISGPQDSEAQLFKEKFKDAPSFFEKYGKQSNPTGEEAQTGKSFSDQMKEKYQQHLRDEAFAQRNASQLAEAKDVPFKLLTQKLKKVASGD